jgi:hypothetical protein
MEFEEIRQRITFAKPKLSFVKSTKIDLKRPTIIREQEFLRGARKGAVVFDTDGNVTHPINEAKNFDIFSKGANKSMKKY